MKKVTFTLHQSYSGDDVTHYAKVFVDGVHTENTPEVRSQAEAKGHADSAIERLSGVNESSAGLLKVDLTEMTKWVVDENNAGAHYQIMENGGNVLSLDLSRYEFYLNQFDIPYTKQ